MSADLGRGVGSGKRARVYIPGSAELGRGVGRGRTAASTFRAELGRGVGIGRVAFAERWYVVYEDATGELLSVGTMLGDVPSGYTAEEINGPPGDDEVWDKVTASFVPRDEAELVDLIDTIMGDADLPETLDVPERVGVRDVLEEHVDDAWRYD